MTDWGQDQKRISWPIMLVCSASTIIALATCGYLGLASCNATSIGLSASWDKFKWCKTSYRADSDTRSQNTAFLANWCSLLERNVASLWCWSPHLRKDLMAETSSGQFCSLIWTSWRTRKQIWVLVCALSTHSLRHICCLIWSRKTSLGVLLCHFLHVVVPTEV